MPRPGRRRQSGSAMVDLPGNRRASDAEERDAAPQDAKRSGFTRFRSFGHEQRRRHRVRVFRVEVAAAPAGSGSRPAAASERGCASFGVSEPARSLRDEAVQGMLRLNHRHGATRFHLVLTAPPSDPTDPAWREVLGATLALRPLVGLILKAPPARIDAELLEALARMAPGREVWLEMAAYPAPGHAAQFAAAARLARSRSIPVIATLILDSRRESGKDRHALARRLNELRVRSVRIHPVQRCEGEPAGLTPEPGDEFPDRESYLDALVDVVERLDPAVELQGLGARTSPARVVTPEWLREPADFHELLELELTRRDSRQGRRRSP